jgi:2-methylfumaryl-CoA hydratase
MPETSNPALCGQGYFLEDFDLGHLFRHATPRTLSSGDVSLYIALTGARQPLHCSAPLARAFGHDIPPIDDILLFNMAFGKTVPDISANAVANLGYADVRFLRPVYPGDTIRAETEVIGARETSSGESGVVYVRSTAFNQRGAPVLTWVRWVLVRKRDRSAPAREAFVPELPSIVTPDSIVLPSKSIEAAAHAEASGSTRFWDDYEVGARIDHPAGMTLDESDHTLATKLYQNNSKVHFDALAMAATPHRRRLVYGGHVISVCRALSYDGLENVVAILAINGGSHRAPTFAGDTLYCYSEVTERIEVGGRNDCGLLRLRLVGLSNVSPCGFEPLVDEGDKLHFRPEVVLDLDYTVLMPRASAGPAA